MPITTCGMAAKDATSPLSMMKFDLRDPREEEVHIKVLYCGICHSDIHQARNEWKNSRYPMVPGHEIVGTVEAVGKKVTKFKVGEKVAVGCMVDSCRHCPQCTSNEEQYCANGMTLTYNDVHKDEAQTPTYGGYARDLVVAEKFVLRVPDGMDLKRCAPLLCAGITVYSPMRRHGALKPGMRVGVVGFGGLGHMAVKIAVASGCKVTLLTRSKGTKKTEDAMSVFKCDRLISVNDAEEMKMAQKSLDFIVDTVCAPHQTMAILNLLDVGGLVIQLGVPPADGTGMMSIHPSALIGARRGIVGSLIGGLEETQELLDFCAQKNILADVETVSADQVNNAYERAIKSDVRYRFVIDVAGTCKMDL